MAVMQQRHSHQPCLRPALARYHTQDPIPHIETWLRYPVRLPLGRKLSSVC